MLPLTCFFNYNFLKLLKRSLLYYILHLPNLEKKD